MNVKLEQSALWYYKDQVKDYINEKHPDARFIAEIALPTKGGGWTDNPGIVLYEEHPPAPFSNKFFAYYRYPDDPFSKRDKERGKWVVTGLSNFDPVVEGVYDTTSGIVAISRYGHDYFTTSPGFFVDGGRNYTRFGGSSLSHLAIVKVNLLTRTFIHNGVSHDFV